VNHILEPNLRRRDRPQRAYHLGGALRIRLDDFVQRGRRCEQVGHVEAQASLATERDERLLGFDVVVFEDEFSATPGDAMRCTIIECDALRCVAEVVMPGEPAHAASMRTARAHDGGSGGCGPNKPTTTVAALGALDGHGV